MTKEGKIDTGDEDETPLDLGSSVPTRLLVCETGLC